MSHKSFFLIPIQYRRQSVLLSLHLDIVCTELRSHMPLQQGPRCIYYVYSCRCIFLLNRLAVYSLPTDLTHESQKEASRICLIYQVVLCHKDGDSKEYPQTYYKTLNQTSLIQKYQCSSSNTFYSLKTYCTH